MRMVLNRPGGAHPRLPICGPVAVAAITGISLERALDLCHPPHIERSRWKGRTWRSDLLRALGTLECRTHEVPMHRKMQLQTFVREMTRPGRHYLVHTGRHWQAVLDGKVLDQTVSTGVDPREYWGRRKLVDIAWEVF